MVTVVLVVLDQVVGNTSRDRRAPAESLANERAENGEIGPVLGNGKTVAADTVQLFMENRQVLGVIAQSKAEALHGRSDGQGTSDSVHTNAEGCLQLVSESPFVPSLFQSAHPGRSSALLGHVLLNLRLHELEPATFSTLTLPLPSFGGREPVGQAHDEGKLVSKMTSRRDRDEKLAGTLFKLIASLAMTPGQTARDTGDEGFQSVIILGRLVHQFLEKTNGFEFGIAIELAHL